MPLFRKPRSPFWWYTITFNGKRYRASTGETTKGKAGTVMANALTALSRGEKGITHVARGATIRTLSERFLEWVRRDTELSENSRKYYTYGWRLIKRTSLADLRVDAITRDDIKCTTFQRAVIDRRTGEETDVIVDCSPAYTNQALRTLKVMLGKAEEWKVIERRPKFATQHVPRREALIDGTAEATLQMAYSKPEKNARVRRAREQGWLFVAMLQDTGVRPDEVFPMRIEHVDYGRNRIWIPSGKTPNARRFVPMSLRVRHLLQAWCADRTDGWVFPSPRSASGHLTTIAKGFQAARQRANLDPRIVPYSARHTFGTFAMGETKNVFAVSKAMGHSDIKSMEPYQHPELDEINDAVNHRNRNRDRKTSIQTDIEFTNSGHTFGHTHPTVH